MRRSRGAAFTLMLLTLFLAACGESTTEPQPTHPTAGLTPISTPVLSTTLLPARYQVQIEQNVAYGPLSAETLDLCLPEGAPGLHPGVILIHGGGWTNGDKSEFAPECSYLASQGLVAATVNYRFAPAYIWPAQLVDVQLAVRFLRQDAKAIMLDPAHLCSWGASAGAHLAVFLSVLNTIHPGDEARLLANQSPAVSCVVDDFGPTNLVTYPMTPAQKGLLELLFGGATLQSNPAIYRDASPVFSVSPASGPTLIVQGTEDTTVPPDQSQDLQTALQRNGVPVQYISYVGDHGFSGLSSEQITAIEAESVSFLMAYD